MFAGILVSESTGSGRWHLNAIAMAADPNTVVTPCSSKSGRPFSAACIARCPWCQYALHDRPPPRICPECGNEISVELASNYRAWEEHGVPLIRRISQCVREGLFKPRRIVARICFVDAPPLFRARSVLLGLLLAFGGIGWLTRVIGVVGYKLAYRLDNGYWSPGTMRLGYWAYQLRRCLKPGEDQYLWLILWLSIALFVMIVLRMRRVRIPFATLLVVFGPCCLAGSVASLMRSLGAGILPDTMGSVVLQSTPFVHTAILALVSWYVATIIRATGVRAYPSGKAA